MERDVVSCRNGSIVIEFRLEFTAAPNTSLSTECESGADNCTDSWTEESVTNHLKKVAAIGVIAAVM